VLFVPYLLAELISDSSYLQRKSGLWFIVNHKEKIWQWNFSIYYYYYDYDYYYYSLNNICHPFLFSAVLLIAAYFPFIRSLSRCILFLSYVALYAECSYFQEMVKSNLTKQLHRYHTSTVQWYSPGCVSVHPT